MDSEEAPLSSGKINPTTWSLGLLHILAWGVVGNILYTLFQIQTNASLILFGGLFCGSWIFICLEFQYILNELLMTLHVGLKRLHQECPLSMLCYIIPTETFAREKYCHRVCHVECLNLGQLCKFDWIVSVSYNKEYKHAETMSFQTECSVLIFITRMVLVVYMSSCQDRANIVQPIVMMVQTAHHEHSLNIATVTKVSEIWKCSEGNTYLNLSIPLLIIQVWKVTRLPWDLFYCFNWN